MIFIKSFFFLINVLIINQIKLEITDNINLLVVN